MQQRRDARAGRGDRCRINVGENDPRLIARFEWPKVERPKVKRERLFAALAEEERRWWSILLGPSDREAGASFLAIPAAFTKQTGEAHWHVLMRSRAIENGCFVFAAAQGGAHENGRATFGHSLVVDPWGQVIAEAGNEPGVVLADVDPAAVAAARTRIPSLLHGRRFEVIEPMAEPTHLRAVQGSQ